jgi:hypothetical protein
VKYILLFTLIVSSYVVFSQSKKANSLELTFSGRKDKYADYVTRFGGVSYTNHLQLEGKGIGISFSYRHAITKNIFFSAGIGSYQMGIDKIWNMRQPSFTGEATSSRPIDYTNPDFTRIFHHTEKYHYNCITPGIGISVALPLSDTWAISTGTDVAYLFTFRQVYHIGKEYTYRRDKLKSFGFYWNASVGLKKVLGKFYIAPSLLLPIYQTWAKDDVFGENPHEKIDKWKDGLGLNISLGKYL